MPARVNLLTNRSGFTLVELLATLGLLAALGVCVVQVAAMSSTAMRDHDHRLAATLNAENIAEVFRGVAYDEVGPLVDQWNEASNPDEVQIERESFQVGELSAWHVTITVRRVVRGRIIRATEHVYVVQPTEGATQ